MNLICTEKNILQCWPKSAIDFLSQWQRNFLHQWHTFDAVKHTVQIACSNIKGNITNLIEIITKKMYIIVIGYMI